MPQHSQKHTVHLHNTALIAGRWKHVTGQNTTDITCECWAGRTGQPQLQKLDVIIQ